MQNKTIEIPAHIVDKAQQMYRAQNAADIFAGVKREQMPDIYLVDTLEAVFNSKLEQKRKQIRTKQAVALAELQAKGLDYKAACKAIGLTVEDASKLPPLTVKN